MARTTVLACVGLLAAVALTAPPAARAADEELRFLDRPPAPARAAAVAPRPVATAAQGPARDDATVAECRANPGSGQGSGWVKNHYAFCQVGQIALARGFVVATFRYTLVGFARTDSRATDFILALDQWVVPPPLQGVRLSLAIQCSRSLPGRCVGGPNGRTLTYAEWQNAAPQRIHLTSPARFGRGPDRIAGMEFRLRARTARAVGAGPDNGFRCDSATYVGTPRGACIFDRVDAFFTLSLSDPLVDETARHIRDAQLTPQVTFPIWAGKTVPGRLGSGEPLTRNYRDRALYASSRRTARATCRSVTPGYPRRGLDCDEYPFASTYQGAGRGDRRYSARALDLRDNRRAGARLAAWYSGDHILDGDPFYVQVVP